MDIETAQAKDAERLALLASETFWDAYRNTSKLEATYIRAYMSKAFTVTQITSELNDPNIRFLLAKNHGTAAGYAKLEFGSATPSVKARKPMEICRIYLARSFWGKGLGQELLDACIEQAIGDQCDAVWLGVWQHNERAIRFYLKHGFEITGEVEFDLASSLQKDHVMARMLQN